MNKKKTGTVWKTKEKDGRLLMICQNSNPELVRIQQHQHVTDAHQDQLNYQGNYKI